MKTLTCLMIYPLLVSIPVFAAVPEGSKEALLQWAGNYHLIFVHFPVALIIMAGVAEALFSIKKDTRYDFVVTFLLVSAALLALPTLFSGMSLEETGVINEKEKPLLEWHEGFAFLTFGLTLFVLFVRNFLKKRTLYLWSLALLIIAVMLTAHLGGLIAFEDFNLLPPFFR